MTDSVPTPNHVTILPGGGGGGGGSVATTFGAPTPANMPPVASPPAQPPAAPPVEPPAPATEPPAPKTPEEYEAMIKELRKENAGWRTKLREAEPIVEKYNAQIESEKTEIQRATERAAAVEADLTARTNELNVLRAAHKHGIPEEDFDLLGSGTPEELDARAARLAARYLASNPTPPPAPPSDRPLESLRPGASPTPPPAVDNSYPADWMPRART
ncbi:hypothetical protein [Nocardia wallacei]|uniref:hypothetical protein n=1 Tax=Nocardia wallacei TaxID=480035 RepID=UPI002455220C|nr:hypothetical protein [Nocardia wallacei]